MAVKKRGLGRGLDALLGGSSVSALKDEAAQVDSRELQYVPLDLIQRGKYQPRRDMDPTALEELAQSIKAHGVMQPIVVRPIGDGRFEIVAGERRWRAAQQAQLHEVPVILRDLDDTEVLEIAIIENIQRADLNPVEEAAGYRQLMDRFGHTQEKLAEALGKSRSHIANLLRLLTLPGSVQEMLQDGRLTAGHARALVTAEEPLVLAQEVVRRGLSVRDTEKLMKRPSIGGDAKTSVKRQSGEKDADTRALEGDLSATLGMDVVIDHSAGQESGQITIRYRNLNDLDTLCSLLGRA